MFGPVPEEPRRVALAEAGDHGIHDARRRGADQRPAHDAAELLPLLGVQHVHGVGGDGDAHRTAPHETRTDALEEGELSGRRIHAKTKR